MLYSYDSCALECNTSMAASIGKLDCYFARHLSIFAWQLLAWSSIPPVQE
jgi:hypothetical protein